jgi:hypothetical protein
MKMAQKENKDLATRISISLPLCAQGHSARLQ